jgi:redox-sensitive bicupin YhaK (pirin superfamily)
LSTDARIEVEAEHEQRACYVVSGTVEIAGERYGEGQFIVLAAGTGPVAVRAAAEARVMLAGGAALDGPRYIEWNFVSSTRERIDLAKSDWRGRRFAPVPGDDERIPLPGE